MHHPSRTAVRALAAACAVALGAAACGPATARPAGPAAGRPAWRAEYLTLPDGDRYGVASVPGGAAVTGGAFPEGSNTRVVAVEDGARPAGDQQVCAAVDAPPTPAQPGLAVRTTASGGAVRAVTLTRNVWGGADGLYNVMAWDSARPEDVPAVLLDQRDHPGLAGWRGRLHMCLRAVGGTASFKVWADGTPEPGWGPGVALPDGYRTGVPGLYAGHLAAGTEVSFTSVGPGA